MGRSETVEALLHPFRENFLDYAPTVLRIKGKDGGIVPFRPNRAQRYLHSRIQDQVKRTGKARILGVKGRQQGFSTYVEGRYFHRVSTIPACVPTS